MKDENEDVIIDSLNEKFRQSFVDRYEASFRKNELLLLENKKFQQALLDARVLLGLEKLLEVADDNVYKQVASELIKQKVTDDRSFAKEIFSGCVQAILKKCDLGEEWSFYVAVFIAKGTPPSRTAFDNAVRIKAIELNSKNELIVKLKPGLNYAEYISAWPEISKVLGKPIRTNELTEENIRDYEIYELHSIGLTYKELASRYFGRMERIDGIEKVKTILQRQKKKPLWGTKISS